MYILNRKIFFFFFLFFSSAIAQNYEISGLVRDKATSKPLGYSSIRIAGTTKGTATNYDGKFILKLNSGSYSLIISYVAIDRILF